ncbi:regulator [uncultured Vibrio sp.]|uniref:regulator n=1 Tax=uncultured Vibrio sp. TaxID=114054 RepID=UPI0025F85856|nr:regulator [uncultured Vibrio sp.]
MKYHDMNRNHVFREIECNLTKEEVTKLCFKSVKEVTEWDEGKEIPRECKRLMRLCKGVKISTSCEWDGFKIIHGRMMLPTGQLISPQQILTGIGLLHIQSDLEIQTSKQLLKLARAIANIRNHQRS